MSKPHRVSIGLPVYNGARYLSGTVEALLGQTYGDFELVISDNHSTDATEEIARDFAARDDRVRYHRNSHNVGLIANFNGVFKLAEGELFKWCGADDLCQPRYLERCVEALDADPDAVLVYPRTQFIDDAGQPMPIEDPGFHLRSADPAERFRYVILANHWVNAVNGLIRRSALNRTRLQRPYPGGDYALLGELCLLGTFVELPETLFLRRLHGGASSQIRSRQDLVELILGRRNGRGLVLPTWQRTFDHLQTIVWADISWSRRFSLMGTLARGLYWRRQRLLDDLVCAARALSRRLVSRS